MLPHSHLLLGIVFVVVILLIFPSIGIVNAAIILAASVLIDVDYYFYYIYKTKKLNPIKAYIWFTKNVKKHRALSKEQKKRSVFWNHDFSWNRNLDDSFRTRLFRASCILLHPNRIHNSFNCRSGSRNNFLQQLQ